METTQTLEKINHPDRRNETVSIKHLGYLDSHQYLLLVGGEVVTLSQEDFPKGSFSQLSLQHDVVSLYVLDDCEHTEMRRLRETLLTVSSLRYNFLFL